MSASDQEPTLRPHTYDGIQEYDQKLPNWWLFTLYIAIVFSIAAWLSYYQLGIGMSDEDRMDAFITARQTNADKKLAGITDDELWQFSRDPRAVEAGKATFMTPGMCVTCHGADLSAMMSGVKLPGLPLNDHEWKHGGKPTDIMRIVRKGAPDLTKGMAPWESVLGVRRVTEVVAFIMSHHKQGEEVKLAPDSPLAPKAP